jgi:hypothetical protein
MKRRTFLKASPTAGAAALAGMTGGAVRAAGGQREFYELRVYEMPTGSRKGLLNDYLSKAAIPAWNRLGIAPVGAFNVVAGPNNLLLYVLIPYPDLEAFVSAPERLAADAEYQKAAAEYAACSIDQPAYLRYESRLLRAFASVPRLRVPAETAEKKPRLFELRVYESHGEAAARKKIGMFNEGGEIALFDRIGLRSVFFGETLAGPRQPNLVYMTVHRDMAAREAVWETFRNDDGWKKLSADPAFADTVSAITIAFLRPTAYSQV